MKNPVPRSRILGLLALLALGVLVAALAGCSKELKSPLAPVDRVTIADPDDTAELSLRNPNVLRVVDIQNRNTRRLMATPDVVGTATTVDASGNLAILVLTEKAVGRGRLPATLEGLPVIEEVTGKIRALDSGAAHRVKQTPPIQLGTSGGWRYDLANGYCCGGTLGSLVLKGGQRYVLSNYHVLEADIVSGGNARVAVAGDPVIQPGLIDVACNANTAQNVATLSGIKSLPGSNVDAAIAQITTGMVNTNGSILDIGTIGASPLAAAINQTVKKSGRTTGLTRSRVTGLNATISVTYSNECAGGTSFTKTFTGQILVRNNGSRFLAGGDSGSLLVRDVSTNPRPIGLLFAGSSSIAVANPIGQVLSFLGATMVGN
jgi:hypothetical protein